MIILEAMASQAAIVSTKQEAFPKSLRMETRAACRDW